MAGERDTRRRHSAFDAGGETPDELATETGRCDCGCENLPLLHDLTQDRMEILTLAVLRHIMSSFCFAQPDSFDAGLDCADDGLGPVAGPFLFAHVLALVRALRRERSVDFLFMPPGNERISEDEQATLALLRAARQRDLDLAGAFAEALARRAATPRLLFAAQALAAVLDRHAVAPPSGATGQPWAAATGTRH